MLGEAICRNAAVQPVALALSGEQTVGKLLAGLLPWVARGGEVYCLDGGNAFDPYGLIQLAARFGVASGTVAERVFVSRAYTCHQLVEATETMLMPLSSRQPPPLALILHLDRMFQDEDLTLDERHYLFERMLGRIGQLGVLGVPAILTTQCAPQTPWGRRLARVAAFAENVHQLPMVRQRSQ